MRDELFVDISRNGYGAVFQMLRDALEQCPPALWDERTPGAPFWQQAYHTLWSIDFYTGEDPTTSTCPAAIDFDSRALSWHEGPAPEPAALFDYLAAVEAKAGRFLAGLTGPRLEAENPFGWTGPTVAHRVFYNIRHTQHHLGIMNAMLSRHGAPAAEWVVFVQD